MLKKRTLLTLIIASLALLSSGFLISAGRKDVPVAEAAIRRDLAMLRSLLQQGVDVNTAQGDGMTALHWAARNDDVKTAEMLLYAGANLKATTRLGAYTPLLIAARQGSTKLVKTLLDAGADPNATTTSGTTALMMAAVSGEIESVNSLLDHGVDIDSRELASEQTALMFAAAYNRAEVVETLLRRGANPSLESTVVDVAAKAERSSALHRERDKILAEAKKKAATAQEKEKASEGEEQVGLEDLETTSDKPAATQKTEQTKAAKKQTKAKESASTPSQRREAVAPEKKEKKRGFFARLFGRGKKAKKAAERPRRISLAELVAHKGGFSALHYAAREGHLETVEKLLAATAEINKVSAGDRTSPLLIAIINGHFDLAMYLLENGADPNLASDAGGTPLYATVNVQWAPHAFYPQPSTRQEQTTHLELLQALLDHRADPNLRLKKKIWYTGYNFDQSGVDEVGATAFWRAAQSSDVDALRLLVAGGADPTIPTQIGPERRIPNGSNADAELDDAKDNLGGPAVSPLHAATGAGYDGNYHRNSPVGWLPAAKYLLEELGADVNTPDHKGYTPLHNAAFRGDNEMILYLVSKGADVTAVSKSGQTTADMANGPIQRIQPFPETLTLLEEMGAKNSDKCVSC